MNEAASEAIALLRSRKHGTLSTLSKRHEGWPFGSVVPYALDRFGAPLILIAGIAEHTKNILADPRVSLLAHESVGDGDIQAKGRVTVLGKAEVVGEAELADAHARYLNKVPDAEGYFATHDFELFRIAPEHVRFIGGFGTIHWVDGAAMALDPAADPLAAGAPGILNHMNADHQDALRLYCRAFAGLEPAEVRMVGVDQYGFEVACQGPDRRVRFEFEAPATPETIRQVMVDWVKKARTALG